MRNNNKNKHAANKVKWLVEFLLMFLIVVFALCATTYEFPETTTNTTSAYCFDIYWFVCM